MALGRNQLEKVRKVLDARYSSLLEAVRTEIESSESQQYIELIGRSSADSGDESVSDLLADLNLDIIDRHVTELRALETARKRMDAGQFGVCMDCGSEIAHERLMVQPAATRCYDCQQQRERTHAHPAGPKL